MSKSVVFFGDTNSGKSTIFGYLFVHMKRIDIEKMKRIYIEKMGSAYNDLNFYALISGGEFYKEQITYDSLTGETKITLVFRKHASSKLMHRFDSSEIQFIDTPGHEWYSTERDAGMFLGDSGVFFIEAKEACKENFNSDGQYSNFLNTWSIMSKGKKFIVLLTKMDLENFSEDSYLKASSKIKQLKGCENINIIPSAIIVPKRYAINILEEPSENMPWYTGLTLIESLLTK